MYTSRAYHTNKHNTIKGLNIYYSPMGSGKTHLIKQLIKHVPTCQVLAPYATCRKDYGFKYYKTSKPLANAPFLYPSQLLEKFHDQNDEYELTVSNYLDKAFRYGLELGQEYVDIGIHNIFFDEIDFAFEQADFNYTRTHNQNFKAGDTFTTILAGIATHVLIEGFTATKCNFNHSIFEIRNVSLNSLKTLMYSSN